jgi:high-affinity nickel-transport protein
MARLPAMRTVGLWTGTAMSSLFLYLIGATNLVVLIDIWRVLRRMRRAAGEQATLHDRLAPRGLISRGFAGLFRMMTRPAQMYWIGLLFGLGFDTATEVGLLTTAGIAVARALPFWVVLSLPLVFAAGMSMVDSADGVMMCGAYGWALRQPARRIYYNFAVTGLSVVVALLVGTTELASVVSGHLLGLHSGVWATLQTVDMQTIGYGLVGLFAGCWLLSFLIWRASD